VPSQRRELCGLVLPIESTKLQKLRNKSSLAESPWSTAAAPGHQLLADPETKSRSPEQLRLNSAYLINYPAIYVKHEICMHHRHIFRVGRNPLVTATLFVRR
jgi:hypothetical protein